VDYADVVGRAQLSLDRYMQLSLMQQLSNLHWLDTDDIFLESSQPASVVVLTAPMRLKHVSLGHISRWPFECPVENIVGAISWRSSSSASRSRLDTFGRQRSMKWGC